MDHSRETQTGSSIDTPHVHLVHTHALHTPQRVATALAAYVGTHMASSPEAVADIVSQFATKLAFDPASLSPRSVEAALLHSPRSAAAALRK